MSPVSTTADGLATDEMMTYYTSFAKEGFRVIYEGEAVRRSRE